MSSQHQEKEGEMQKGWTSKVFEGVISVSLFMLALGLPIFFTGVTFQGIALDRQVYFYFWLLIGFVAWASLGVVSGEMKIRRTPIDLPLLVFVLVYGVSALFSVDKWHSFFGFFGDPSHGFLSIIALYLTYYFVASQYSARRFVWMTGGFLVASIIVIAWSFLVIRGIHFMPIALESYAPLSLMGSVSGLTIFLGMLFPIFITTIFLGAKMKKGVLRSVFFGVIGIAIVFDLFLLTALSSYVSWVAIIGGMAFFLMFILSQVVRPDERYTWIPMMIFVVLLLSAMWGSQGMVKAQLPVEVSPDLKLSWEVAKGSIQENFFFGSGPATYGYNFSLFKPESFNQSSIFSVRFYEGSSALFESISTIGILGAIALVIVVLSYASVGLYLLGREKKHNKILSLALWSSSVMFLIAFFSMRVNGPLLLVGSMIAILSLVVLLSESDSESSWFHLSLKAAPKFALTLAFIFMVVSAGVAMLFVFMGKLMLADVYAGKAVRAAQPSIDGSLKDLARAIAYYPKEGRYYTRLGQEQLVLAIAETRKAESDQNKDMATSLFRYAMANSEKASGEFLPNDVATVEGTALVYENISAATDKSDRDVLLPKAKEQYEKAIALDPKNPLLHLKVGQIKKALADQKEDGADKNTLMTESEEALKKSIELKDNFAVSHYTLAVIKSNQKDFDAAIEHASQAVRLEGKNLTYRYNLGILYQVRDKEKDTDVAEAIFKNVLETNEKLIDVRLSLGLLYEKKKKTADAIATYEKGLEFLNDADVSSNENITNLKKQIEKMIDTVRRGGSNLGKPTPQTESVTEETAPAAVLPAENAGVPEINQNPSIQEVIPQ